MQQNVVVLVGRILLSILFIIAGYGKLTALGGTAGYFGSMGLPVPMVTAVIVTAVELLGGIAILVIEALLPQVDTILVGGGMCFTFLKAQGHGIGTSLLEDHMLDQCRTLLESGKVVLPVDVVAASAFSAEADHDVVGVSEIPDDRMGLDIGPESVALFASKLADACSSSTSLVATRTSGHSPPASQSRNQRAKPARARGRPAPGAPGRGHRSASADTNRGHGADAMSVDTASATLPPAARFTSVVRCSIR